MLNHSFLSAPTQRIRLDFESLVISFYLNKKGLVRVAQAVISEILTGRFSRQLLVAATAKRSVSRASSGPGVGGRPSRNAAKKASS